MKLTRLVLAAALALSAATAASASSVNVQMTGDGNIGCINARGTVYLSGHVRGDYNRLCMAALWANGLSDIRGNFNDVDLHAARGATIGFVVRGDGNTFSADVAGAGTTVGGMILGNGINANLMVRGTGSQVQFNVIR